MPHAYRRIVTGHNAAGRSAIIQDGPSPNIVTPPSGLRIHEMWETRHPASNTEEGDPAIREPGIEPHDPNGTIFRFIEFPPDSERDAEDIRRSFETLGSDHHLDRESSIPGMHETQTVDYAIVTEGEVWAVLDEGETKMTAGDVLIQRGTNHAWSNRSDETAVIAFILVGAEPRK